MRRRFLLASTAATALASVTARAQQKAMPVIGNLNSTSPVPAEAKYVAAFIQGLGETGYVVGSNVTIEYRYGEGHFDRLPALASDLVGRKVDVITVGSMPGALAARNATSTIPIVFSLGGDPVAAGLVASLARPGGNITGVSILNVELVPKRFELISDLVPQARTTALLVNPNNPVTGRMVREVEEAAHRKDRRVEILNATSKSEIDAAFGTLLARQVGALVIGTDPVFSMQREQLSALASRYAIPTIFAFPVDGALISYGTNLLAVNRRTGVYTGRILKGENPADLPVEQPSAFEMVINLGTARALGLTIPPSILARADEVIE